MDVRGGPVDRTPTSSDAWRTRLRSALTGVRSWPARRWWWAALAAVLLCGFLPYAELLGHLPWGADATRWMTDGSLNNRRWWHWATSTKHFIGYRPVTALSYVLNHAIAGYAPWAYRAVDLALHLSIGVLVFALFRRWTGDRGGWGLIAVAILYGHPASEEVVPYLARRSYLLATSFGLAGLLAWTEACRDRRWFSAWAPLSALLLGVAVLSNEMAYVLVPLMPLLGWTLGPDRGWLRPLVQYVPTVVVGGLAFARRWQVLETITGGYQKKYFAVWVKGRPMWRELKEVDHLEIAEAAWSYLLDPISVSGHAPLYQGVGLGVLAVGAVFLMWAALVRPVRRLRFEAERLPWVLSIWLLGGTLLIMISETWFWRQAYLLLVPLALLVATVARSTLRPLLRAGERPPWARLAVVGVPQVVLVAGLLWNAPYWGGIDRAPHMRRIRSKDAVLQIRDLTADLEGPALVWMVVPMRGNRAHITRIWATNFGEDRGIHFKLLASLSNRGKELEADAEVRPDPTGRLLLTIDEEHFQWASTPGAPAIRRIPELYVDKLWRAGRREAWLLVLDADDELLIEVPEPPDAPDRPLRRPPVPTRPRLP